MKEQQLPTIIMLDQTLQAKRHFQKVTGKHALTVKQNRGSMRPYITVTMSMSDPAVKEFRDNFYKASGDGNYNNNFFGIPVKYIGGEWKGKIRFEIEREYLMFQP